MIDRDLDIIFEVLPFPERRPRNNIEVPDFITDRGDINNLLDSYGQLDFGILIRIYNLN